MLDSNKWQKIQPKIIHQLKVKTGPDYFNVQKIALWKWQFGQNHRIQIRLDRAMYYFSCKKKLKLDYFRTKQLFVVLVRSTAFL